MRVLVTGGKGDLGRRLVPLLQRAGHAVLVGTRRPRHDDEVYYALMTLEIREGVVTAIRTVINPEKLQRVARVRARRESGSS